MRIGNYTAEAFGYACAVAGFLAHSGRALSGPVSAFIEPTNVCNLHCPLCACGAGMLDRPSGRMGVEAFRRIIDALPSTVRTLYLWGQGEPFLAPDFTDMIRYASASGRRTIVSTNGHRIEDPADIIDSGLDRLIVSIDGIDSETYEEYRSGGDFERVVGNVRKVAELESAVGKGPVIELQYLLTAESLKNVTAFKSLARSIGAHRVTFKTVQAVSMPDGDSWLPEDPAYTRYRKAPDGTFVPDRYHFLENRCLRIYYSVQIDWQGNVLPCCFDKNSEFIMGNIFTETFAGIWNSDEYRSFRSMFVKNGRVLPMCRDCTEGLKRVDVNL